MVVRTDGLDLPLASECPVKRVLHPGEYLYVVCPEGFFVRARIVEVQLIVMKPDQQDSVWVYISEDGTSDMSDDQLLGCSIYNQFPWVDWPIGHAAYIGDYGFYTLDEARAKWGRFREKGKYRRAKQYLRRVTSFIASTWEGAHPGWPPLKSYYRKIYT